MVSQISDSNYNDDEPGVQDESHGRRMQTNIFAHITNMDADGLESHLAQVKGRIDVTQIYNSGGFSPLHLASFKSLNSACDLLIKYVLEVAPFE